jgi:hypothetical protein
MSLPLTTPAAAALGLSILLGWLAGAAANWAADVLPGRGAAVHERFRRHEYANDVAPDSSIRGGFVDGQRRLMNAKAAVTLITEAHLSA